MFKLIKLAPFALMAWRWYRRRDTRTNVLAGTRRR